MADSWVLWIRAGRRQIEPSSEVATNLKSSESSDRKELQAASAAQAVDLSETPDIQVQVLAAFLESAATIDRHTLREFSHGSRRREKMPHDWILVKLVHAEMQSPTAHQDGEIGFLNTSVAARNQLRSSFVPCHETDLSTDLRRGCPEAVQRPVW